MGILPKVVIGSWCSKVGGSLEFSCWGDRVTLVSIGGGFGSRVSCFVLKPTQGILHFSVSKATRYINIRIIRNEKWNMLNESKYVKMNVKVS